MLLPVLITALLGISFGSFINALVWRLHQQEVLEKKNIKSDQNLSILTGRSMCPNCHHKLSGFDLIPILSWLLLRGKCRYCKQKISFQYPLVETLTLLASLLYLSFWHDKNSIVGISELILQLLTLYGLISLFIYDMRWYKLPTRIIYGLYFFVIPYQFMIFYHSNNKFSFLSNLFISALIGGGLFYVLHIISNGKWIGGGDVRLGFLLGLSLGNPIKSILLIFISSLLGSLVGVFLIIFKKLNKKSLIPYGPFLILSYFLVQLFGNIIISWARNHYLI